jgi:hypothetical protein
MNKELVVRLMMGIFVVLALPVCQEASAQRFRGGGGRGIGMMHPHAVSPMYCIQNPGVQKELGLNKAATGKVNRLLTEYRDRARKQRESTSDRGALRKKLDAEYGRKLNAILDKAQWTRLREIAIQVAGVDALQDPTVIEQLDLTKDQQDKIAGIIETLAELDPAIVDGADEVVDSTITSILSAGHLGHGAHADAGPAAYLEHRREQLDKVAAVLTKHQQEKFENMKGKPFTFTPGGRGRGAAR